uniref:Protein kinase domain-containing protein n=1 Tax=Macrostomum lignano TaxID=282301 RepID=A0A1I8GYE3_9PLAT
MWSAGAVIFFVATGYSPFAPAMHEPKEVVYSRVATVGCDWSLLAGHESESLVQQLLVKEADRRLKAEKALKHDFLRQRPINKISNHGCEHTLDEKKCIDYESNYI